MSKLAVFNKNLIYTEKYDWTSYTSWRYHRLLFRSFILRGKKLAAFNFMVNLRLRFKLKENVDPYLGIYIALLKITPDILVYPLKLGGAVQRVPLYISERKQYTYAVKWVIKLLKEKHGRIYKYSVRSVADTLIAAIYGKGPAIEKKLSIYQNSMVNRHLVRFYKF